MKFIFFGTPRFAEIVLDELLGADMPPVALVCNPDRPIGRKKIVTPPPAKQRALRSDASSIDIIQPEALDEAFVRRLKVFEPDLFVVAAYAKILPRSILDIPRLGTLGVHPSLLPKYRGASPIQSTILADETETGTTIYLMDEKTDHGPILDAGRLPLSAGETYLTLEEKLAKLGGALLVKTMPEFFAGRIRPRPQDESQATTTKKFRTEDGFVDESDLDAATHGDAKKATEILRKINALNPEPGVWTNKDDKRVKLLAAEMMHGSLRLTVTQQEGGKPVLSR